MATEGSSENATLLFVLSGLKLSAEETAAIENKLKSTLLQELARIDNTKDFTATPLSEVPEAQAKVLGIPGEGGGIKGLPKPFPIEFGTSGYVLREK
jgi:hypothetical protein